MALASSIACETKQGNGWSCRNGILDPGEECDDGNAIDTDGCTSDCRNARCGDGFIRVGVEQCDDGNILSSDGCDNDCHFSCHGDEECDDGHLCTDDVCDIETHVCSNELTAAETLCRLAEGDCDIAEYCTGEDADCPEDAFRPITYICRGAAEGGCDIEETCPGDGPACPEDEFQPDWYACRDAASGGCDVLETCPGDGPDCPEDVFHPDTYICRDEALGGCDVAETCPGDGPACPDDGFKPDTYTCREAASGGCDVAETCPGDGVLCPDDSFRPGTYICRDIAPGGCDVAEYCPGDGPNCPGDAFRPDTYLCRDAEMGECSQAEYCPGDGPSCPPNTHKPDSIICRESTIFCDPAEYCPGDGPLCPDDVFLCCGNGTLEPDEECDDGNVENSDGCDNDCTFSCTEANQAVDCSDELLCTDDLCDGATHTCFNPVSVSTVICRPEVGACDVTENCDGVNPTCPTDIFQPNTIECRASAGVCDVSENCTGTSADCPVNAFLPGTTECRASAGVCDVAENCTGMSANCPIDVLRPNTYECRPAAGICDAVEYCDGISTDCPADVLRPSTYECRPSTSYCDLTEYCTGTGPDCPLDAFTGELHNISAIAAGFSHTCALLSTGGVKCWGSNYSGQLGDGTTTNKTTPVNVSGLSSGVSAIAAGFSYTCALLSTGGVKCWGSNGSGQLGDGTATDKTAPVNVSGLSSGVSAVAAGGEHSCAIMRTGDVKCWGDNLYGQLGDGTRYIDRTTPVDVSGLSSGVSAISTGGDHTCALLSGGGVNCWGLNATGQLGDGTYIVRTTPVDVSGLSSTVSAISSGNSHTCALLFSGGVKCWGWNWYGQLGDGTMVERTAPVDVLGLSSGVSAISADYHHTCALLSGGGVNCWGWNNYGQLGDGTMVDRTAPVDVLGLSSGVSAISTGNGHTCALFSGGGVNCWGRNNYGQLGDGTTNNRLTPVDVVCN